MCSLPFRALFLTLLTCHFAVAAEREPLPGTAPLTQEGDLSAQMVTGIQHWLGHETERVAEERRGRWRKAREAGGAEFLNGKREELRQILGVVDPRLHGALEEVSAVGPEKLPSLAGGVTVHRVRWPVLEGVNGEGILLQPAGTPRAAVIVLPDADQTPEQAPMAQALARWGCLVLVPTLVNREQTLSGSAAFAKFTNEPHREWIYRQAFVLGRTVIGYEVQRVLAAREALAAGSSSPLPIGIAGYGEGGLIALHAAALEPGWKAALVSGYFGPREQLYREPIYRNLFGVLRDFGNAEVASMVAPAHGGLLAAAPLIIEYSHAPKVDGPPARLQGRNATAAPGALRTPEWAEVRAELDLSGVPAELVAGEDRQPLTAGSGQAMGKFASALGLWPTRGPKDEEIAVPKEFADARQQRTVRELENYTQSLIRAEERGRTEGVWNHVNPGPEWDKAKAELKQRLWNTIGRLPGQPIPPNVRTRRIIDNPKWTAYEVMLDVRPEVYAWGWLLLPKDMAPGERRPVVVCQHGLEGVPADTVTTDPKDPGFKFYKGFSARLAEQGFIVYAPHNPYRGHDEFREIQRRANPLGLSLYSFIIEQHDVTLQWLASLPFVDPARIGFYGLSYGGKTAMRVPAMVDRYALSICSGDFNEWISKISSTDYRSSYIFTPEYEMSEWNLANAANYAEMALLISPRPFMVERGHDDGVGADEWVGYEYAKVRRGYDKLGIGDRTSIEWFDGPHTIHGIGTFDFLHQFLAWPRK